MDEQDNVLDLRTAARYMTERGYDTTYRQARRWAATGDLPFVKCHGRFLTTTRALDIFIHRLGDCALDAMRVA